MSEEKINIPNGKNIELPLLKALHDEGGKLYANEAIEKTKTYYLELTKEAKASRLESGQNRLNNRIAWVKQSLVNKNEIDRTEYGVWRITDKGEKRLAKEWNGWKPKYIELREHSKSIDKENKKEKGISKLKIAIYHFYSLRVLSEVNYPLTRQSIVLNVYNKLKRQLSAEDYENSNKTGLARWEAKTRWAVTDLYNAGLAKSLGRNKWIITKKGINKFNLWSDEKTSRE